MWSRLRTRLSNDVAFRLVFVRQRLVAKKKARQQGEQIVEMQQMNLEEAQPSDWSDVEVNCDGNDGADVPDDVFELEDD